MAAIEGTARADGRWSIEEDGVVVVVVVVAVVVVEVE